MTKEEYEKDLKSRQKIHLDNVSNPIGFWQPCLHDQCLQCIGTGVKISGESCIHFIYCTCPKCSPQYIAGNPSTGSIFFTSTDVANG